MRKSVFGVCGLFICCSAVAETGLPTKIAPFEQNSVVSGALAADPECGPDKRNPQIWLSIGQILLYQVEVPVNGSYEFHVVPGKYDLVATTSKGCLAEAEIQVTPKQVAQVNLRLAPPRAPASAGKGDVK